jgi:uncharacterized membrane protein HdeD (DUF308 family)
VSVAALVLGVAMLGSGGRGLHLIVNLLGIYFLVIGSLRLARAAEARRTAPAGDTR